MHGRTIGPYQMQRYYEDAVEHNPTLRSSISYSDLKGPGSIEKSEKIACKAYSNRYTTAGRIGQEPTFEDAARNHNGGPNGYKKDSTLSYNDKVEHNRNRNKHAVIYSSATGEYLGCPNLAILQFRPNVYSYIVL